MERGVPIMLDMSRHSMESDSSVNATRNWAFMARLSCQNLNSELESEYARFSSANGIRCPSLITCFKVVIPRPAQYEGSRMSYKWGSVELPHSGVCGDSQFGLQKTALASFHTLSVVFIGIVRSCGALAPLNARTLV